MTMVPNPALKADLVASFERALTPDEDRVAQNWLNQAWTILVPTIPGIDTRLGLGSVSRNAVVQVLVAMVERKLRNPNGLRTWQGDNYTETIDQTLSSGQLYPTVDEIARLSVGVAAAAGMYSVPFC